MKKLSKTLQTLFFFTILFIIPVVFMHDPVQASENYSYDPVTKVLEINSDNGFLEFQKDHELSFYSSPHYNVAVQTLKINPGVTRITENAFSYCYDLESVSLPESLTYIGEFAFKYCINLKSVSFSEGLQYIGGSAFSFCRSLGPVKLPESVRGFGEFTFLSTENMTQLTLPSRLLSISNYSLDSCNGLKTITIPDSVNSIGDYALRRCKNLLSITIPENVTSIGKSAFNDCRKLSSITLESTSVPTLGKDAFLWLSKDYKIYVPCSKDQTVLNAYKKAYRWRDYQNRIFEAPHAHTAGDWITARPATEGTAGIKNKECTLCGEVMESAEIEPIGDTALSFNSGLYRYTVNSGASSAVDTVEVSGFAKGKSTSKVSINKTVSYKGTIYKITAIGENAFSGNKKIKHAAISNNLVYIGNKAFNKCPNLQKLTVGTGLRQIGAYAFNNDKKLNSLTIKSSNLYAVGKKSLSQCRNLKISVPASKVKAYSTLFKNKGQSKTVKVTK